MCRNHLVNAQGNPKGSYGFDITTKQGSICLYSIQQNQRNSGHINWYESGNKSLRLTNPLDSCSNKAPKYTILSAGIPEFFHIDTAGTLILQILAILVGPPSNSIIWLSVNTFFFRIKLSYQINNADSNSLHFFLIWLNMVVQHKLFTFGDDYG